MIWIRLLGTERNKSFTMSGHSKYPEAPDTKEQRRLVIGGFLESLVSVDLTVIVMCKVGDRFPYELR